MDDFRNGVTMHLHRHLGRHVNHVTLIEVGVEVLIATLHESVVVLRGFEEGSFYFWFCSRCAGDQKESECTVPFLHATLSRRKHSSHRPLQSFTVKGFCMM